VVVRMVMRKRRRSETAVSAERMHERAGKPAAAAGVVEGGVGRRMVWHTA
jgi:hypothetical protein